jgi:hypothetical protein
VSPRVCCGWAACVCACRAPGAATPTARMCVSRRATISSLLPAPLPSPPPQINTRTHAHTHTHTQLRGAPLPLRRDAHGRAARQQLDRRGRGAGAQQGPRGSAAGRRGEEGQGGCCGQEGVCRCACACGACCWALRGLWRASIGSLRRHTHTHARACSCSHRLNTRHTQH